MEILKATPYHLVEILFLLKECVYDLNQKGLKHWNNSFPGSDLVRQDLENGSIYMCRDKGVLKGMVTLVEKAPEEYSKVDWKGDASKVLYVLRLAVHPTWQGAGIAKQLMDYSEKYAADNGFKSIRMDAYSGDEYSVKVLSDTGYNETGKFHSEFQQTPYFCYEKGL